jgi:GNAT superfamily N-acetyltransferase
MGKLTSPQPIHETFVRDHFDCGEISLNTWLIKKALVNEKIRGSRTFVVCCRNEVVGYYCLAAGSLLHTAAPGKIRRNMPDPIPVMLLGRLAVDHHYQHKGIGSGLLKDAMLRALMVAKTIGIKALLVHAINREAVNFYRGAGFIPSPINNLTLMMDLGAIEKALSNTC